jgi:uncharacterized protein YceK
MKTKHIYFTLISAFSIVLVLSGCASLFSGSSSSSTSNPGAPATKQLAVKSKNFGFPLIDIVDANVDVANNSQFNTNEVKWTRSANTKIIGGALGSKIVAKDITIRLIDTSIQLPIKEGEDLSSWFLNIPAGLKATAHSRDRESKIAADKGAQEVIVTISGTPEQTINRAVLIRVPYTKTNRSWDFDIPPNEDIRFEVYGVNVAPIIVGGAVNREIDPKTFKIKIGGTTLANTIELDQDLSSWFTNLPRGLKAVSAEETVPATEGQQSVTVTISGKPAILVNEQIKIVIPARATVANIVLTIPPTDYAKYDIGTFATTSANNVELSPGTNWKGATSNWGLTGPGVFQTKDFTAAGIIQITAQSVYAIGVDGNYHWTGNTITYGNLMAEARRLNAHAIIDVVIDTDDQISETIERRHVEANHVPTPLEVIKMSKKPALITIEADPNGGVIYVETIRVTRRTWTGTALAIQYAPAYAPNIGEGHINGYVPALPGSGGR